MAGSQIVFDPYVSSDKGVDLFLEIHNNAGELDEGKFFSSMF
jgi:hypothetical protein